MIQLYDRDVLFEEVAFVAYHFGWSHDEVLELPHWERHRWCEEISEINEEMNQTPSEGTQTESSGLFDSGGTILTQEPEDLE